eukprot:gb/GECH01013355.1/.p1 GENE.gb/GECH01013355.1/~~gb/GECH01013355.1/.p1  ORF type:complete len:298 (+),score=59.84 gb/GECH01013355.1/:1-894(+)
MSFSKPFSIIYIFLLLFITFCILFQFGIAKDHYPQPFHRKLEIRKPLIQGTDVYILQNLIKRFPDASNLNVTKVYDLPTQKAVQKFQLHFHLFNDKWGVFGKETAQKLLELYLDDHYQDDGSIPSGYLYKVHVPIHQNRSIETKATLYDNQMNVRHTFTARTHGQNDPRTGQPLNQLSNSGSTPTGLMTFDLNSPEPDHKSFGPYPVNRAVLGLQGNAEFALPHVRNGILLHTGEWEHWNPSMPMPNSHGCIHAHPDDIKEIWHILVSMGVKVHKNPFGKLPYPYKPQGVLSVEMIE